MLSYYFFVEIFITTLTIMFIKENKLEHKSLEFYRGDQPNENLVGSFKAAEKKKKNFVAF